MTARTVLLVLALAAPAVAQANEVVRSQLSGPFTSCREWTTAHKAGGARKAELEALARGYAEGVAAHVQRREREGRFSMDDYFGKISAYCADYEDDLLAAAEIVLERQWPGAGDKLTAPGADRPAPKGSYTFVPGPPPKASGR